MDQSYSQLAMPAVSQSAELSVAWALVCILHILASDSLQSREDQHDSVLVAPPPGLDPPSHSVAIGKEQQNRWTQKCKCHFCSFKCCRAGRPPSVQETH